MNDSERRQHCIDWMTTTGQDWLSVTHIPEPGSALAGDDKVEPRVSRIAAFAIAVALDHLGSVVDTLTDERPMRHFAHFSALRATLLTASQASWILYPSMRNDRRNNALSLERTNIIEQRKAINASNRDHLTPEQAAAVDQAKQVMNDRIAAIEVTAASSGVGNLSNLASTEIIARAVEGISDTDDWFEEAVRQLWRTGSAAAHGYSWRLEFSDDPQHFDEQLFNPAFYGAFLMTQHAVDLYATRSRAHCKP